MLNEVRGIRQVGAPMDRDLRHDSLVLGAALTAVTLTAITFNPSWPPARTDLPAEAFAREDAMPDDPAYRPRATATGCAGQHALYGFVPDCAAGVREDRVGTSVDRAWAWTIGHPDVIVAPLADGVDWDDPDLVARWYLDAGELPAPRTSTVSASHDANQDGVFSVLDYTSATGTIAPTVDRIVDLTLLAREDRGDVNGNGLLDPQDLSSVFANGIDDDDDGYVDDIAGWDHVDGDNDPGVDAGASEAARTIAATANNGLGSAGVCPACRIVPMRVARRGQTHGDVLASALEYAAREGASIVASFAEALEASARLAEATDVALERDVLIVSTTGRRPDRRRPVVWDPDDVLFVGGIGYDAEDPREATTALSPDPCSGFGSSIALSAPARCDERGAAIVAGIAALVRSAARGIPARGVTPTPLDVEALRMLLTATSEDVRPRESESAALTPALRGWDERTGFGRVDALAAIEALVRQNVPNAARIIEPAWFEILDPTVNDRVLVKGEIDVAPGERVAWTLTVATGAAPDLDAFVTLASGSLEGSSDIAGELDLAGLFADPAGAARAVGDFQVTVLLATRRTRDGEVVVGEARRVFTVHRDLLLWPAFPVRLGAGVVAGPRVLDLDGDGALEIVVATVDGEVFAIDRNGARVAGFGVTTPDPILATPSGVFGTNEGPWLVVRGLAGSLTVVDPGGGATTIVEPSKYGATSSPALFDLDGDGVFEIVTANGLDLEVRRRDGAMVDGWPQALDGVSGTPSIGDVDGDGAPEIVAVTPDQVFVFERDGTLASGSPLRLPAPDITPPPSFFAPSAALGDLDLDGRVDIVAPVLGGAAVQIDSGARTVTTARGTGPDFGADGSPWLGASNLVALGRLLGDAPSTVLSLASASTLDGLGASEVGEYGVAAFGVDGEFETGFVRATEGRSPLDALLADLDGDRRPEIVFGESDRLRAAAFDGSRPPGYPKLTGDEVIGTPVVEDLDGDGLLELVAVTRTGVLFVWRTRGRAEGVAWNGHHHDLAATGNLAAPALAGGTIDEGSGCGCRSSGTRSNGWVWLLAGLAITSSVRRCGSRGSCTRSRTKRGGSTASRRPGT